VALTRSAARASLLVPAPAKLNLFLHVTGRRDGGYHELESLFVALDYGDTVALARRDDGEIRRRRELPGVPERDDLTVRAARALKDETGTRFGVDIAVDKRIPVGAGLGGGSSDAASTLLALNRLWDLRLARAALLRIALALGADVPFFVFGEPALARGIGERLTAVSLPPLWVVVLAPSAIVPTAAIFAAPELTRSTPSLKMDVFSEGYGRNDLQAVAVARFPDIAAALAQLRACAPAARMTGSGACVFAAFASASAATAALAGVCEAEPGRRGFVARTLARHPLAAFA
jgi:4-diphosphocytidyl-2-C-methyl-D-erythritol kinase